MWYDTDGDGVQDVGESGASGVLVTLSGGGLTTSEVATTNGSGNYDFTGLAAGTYTVDFAAPSGYGFSTPAGGETVVAVTAGQTDSAVDAGLYTVPTLDAVALVAARGYDYTGVVAAVEGTAWSTSQLAATIEWGDGTQSAGTLVDVSGTLEVMGDHTYTHEGVYALAVRVDPTASPTAAAFAAGLADVLAPTDHRGLQEASSVAASGGVIFPESVVVGAGGFSAASGGATFDYTLSESVNEPGDSFTLTRTGTAHFTLSANGPDFRVQPPTRPSP